jgi:hypothetical protein
MVRYGGLDGIPLVHVDRQQLVHQVDGSRTFFQIRGVLWYYVLGRLCNVGGRSDTNDGGDDE